MTRLLVLGMVPLLAVASYSRTWIEPHLAVRADYTQSEMQAAKESIALSLMGQLQFTVGDLLWMKSQEYLHGGMVLRMPTKAEEAMGIIARDSVGAPAGLSHADGVLMSPEKERDWRGILGEIDRHIIPHAEHRHEDPVELIPWYQLVVRLNPHQERVYSMAAFFMSDSAQSPGDALHFLHKGLEANPWSWEIRGGIGRLLHDYAEQPDVLAQRKGSQTLAEGDTIPKSSERAYELAIEMLEAAAEGGLEDRVELAKKREVFDDYQAQLFRESYLMLAKSFTELERWDEALETCERGHEVTKHNHFRVQARTIKKRMRDKGLKPPEDSLGDEVQLQPAPQAAGVSPSPKPSSGDDEAAGGIKLNLKALSRQLTESKPGSTATDE